MWFKARRSSFYPSAAQSIERFILFLQVIMATKEAAERACKEPNPIIDGRKANVNLAILGAKPRINSFQGKQTLLRSRVSLTLCMRSSTTVAQRKTM